MAWARSNANPPDYDRLQLRPAPIAPAVFWELGRTSLLAKRAQNSTPCLSMLGRLCLNSNLPVTNIEALLLSLSLLQIELQDLEALCAKTWERSA